MPGVEGLEERQLLTIAANADLFGAIEGTPLTVQAPGVLANDRDSTGATLQVSASTPPTHGGLTIAPDGSFVYSPAASYVGPDSFTYTASDPGGGSAVGTVNLVVSPERTEATVFAGPRLASVDTSQSALLNGLLGGLTGTSLNLTAADWTGLSGAQINGGQLASALQAELGVSSPAQALTANATLSQIDLAAATVAQADGQTAAASALNSLATSVGGLTTPVHLGDLLQVNPNDGSLATTSLNALDLATGAVQLYNFDNVATTPTPVTISGASLGLPASIGSVTLAAQVVEPPIITTGPTGTAFHSAATRLALTLNLGSDPIDVSTLVGPLGSALGDSVTASASLSQVMLYVEVAEGQGTIAAIDAIGDSVTLQATPGLADVYLGSIPAALFNDRTHVINPATDLGYGPIGTLNLVATVPIIGTTLANDTVGIQARSFALGQAPSATTEVFNGPFPQSKTVTTGASFITNLANSLVSNLSVQLSGMLSPLLNPLVGTIQPLLTTAVANGVTPLLAPALTGVVDPALQMLGTGLGELILTVDGLDVLAAPIANPDDATTPENTPVTIAVLGNDASLPGDVVTVTSATAPAQGVAVINSDGTITYTPTAGFTGMDAFTYTITDANGLTSTGSVTVTVTPPPPIAVGDSYTATAGTPLIVAPPGVLGNDSDPAGLPLTALMLTNPAHGTLIFNADGSFTYTPTVAYFGADSFTYRDTDGSGFSQPATVSLTVNPAAPIANNDSYTATAGTPLIVAAPGVLGNDSDPAGRPLSAVLLTNPAHGTLTLNANGSFNYTPAVAYFGADSFTYRDGDGAAFSTAATVSLTVNPAAPIANNDSFTATAGTPLIVAAPGVLGNDTDPAGRPLSAVVLTGPAHGTLALNPNGSFTYTPAVAYFGPDSFTYRDGDGAAFSPAATVSLTVNPAAPIANNDSFTATAGTPLIVAAPGVLGNDTDPAGRPLSAVLLTNPAHGTLTLNANGSFSYTPAVAYFGADSFSYRDTDGAASSPAATVSLTVNPAPPVANGDSYAATSGVPLVVAAPGVLGNDSDPAGRPLTPVLVSTPAHGSVALRADGSFTYTPAAGYFGPDAFTYRDGDGAAFSPAATVTLNVQPAPPTAVNDSYSAMSNVTLVIPGPGVLANDISPAGLPLTAQLVTGAAHGTLTLGADGSIRYVPVAGFAGTDGFTYRDSDGTRSGNAATVTLVVSPTPPRPPVANGDSYTATAGVPLVVAAPGVLANDTDPAGLTLSAVLLTGPAHGTLTLNANGSFTYSPAVAYFGPDSFTYRDSNGAASSQPATVSLTVNPAAPIARADSYTATAGTPLIVAAPGVLGNDTDPAGRPLSAVLAAGPAHGVLALNPNGSFTYTPAVAYFGADSFSYRDTDGAASSPAVTVSLAVNPALPIARGDLYSATEGKPLVVAAPGVLGNDTDPAGRPLSAFVLAAPAHGTLALNPDGSFTYTPAAGYLGPDAFSYRDADGVAFSPAALVSLAVNPPAPVAVNDYFMAISGSPLVISSPGVLGNDSGPPGVALAAQLVGGPAHGTLAFHPDGSFSYTSNPGYLGPDSFSYRDQAGAGFSNAATVTFAVHTTPPVASGDAYAATAGTTLVIASPGVLGNDRGPAGFPLSAQLLTNPAHGALTLNPDGSFAYAPAAGYLGPDSFTYRDAAGGGFSPAALVSLAVNPGPPVARADSYSASTDLPLVVSAPGVLGNDGGPPGVALVAQLVGGPAHGTLALNPDGSFTYTSAVGYVGTDSFTYRDAAGSSVGAPATVTLAVYPQPRIVQPRPVMATQGVPFAGFPVLFFSDPGTNGAPPTSPPLINWGDGSAPSTGMVVRSGAGYLVTGGHTYATAGNYAVTVSVQDPNGGPFTATTTAAVAAVSGSLSGVVYDDLDRNGLRSANEAGLGGMTILLAGTNSQGQNVNLSTVTAADGSYRFSGLAAGNYAMAELTIPTAFGSRATAGSLGGVTSTNLVTSIPLGPGASGFGYNFGETIPSDIRGTLYLDNDRLGRDTSNDFGVANIVVTLTGTDILGNHVSRSVATAADGSYSFGGLFAGTYQVTAARPDIFQSGADNPGTAGGSASGDTISGIRLASGTDANGYNFGEFIKPGCMLALPAYQNLLRYGPHPTGIPASAFAGTSAPPGSQIAYYVPMLADEINAKH